LVYQGLGYTSADVMIPHRLLDPQEVDELSIRLNRHAGEDNFDILANEFEVEDLLDWGFDSKELGLPSIDEMLEETKETPQKIQFVATFDTKDDLDQISADLAHLVDKTGGKYKIKD